MTEKLAGLVIPVLEPLGYRQGWGTATGGWCEIPNPSVDGVVVGVSVNVWNAKRRLLERVLATSSKRRRSFESQASFEVGNSRVLDDKQLDLD